MLRFKGCEMNEISETESNDNDIEENGKRSELSFFNVSAIASTTKNYAELKC